MTGELEIVVERATAWCASRSRPTWWRLESASPGFQCMAAISEGGVSIGQAFGGTPAKALKAALRKAVESSRSRS